MSDALNYVRALATTGPSDASGLFSVDAYHAMERRDIALIADELEHGATSAKFVYSFPMDGKTVTGVSVVGARHLVAFHGGIKHRIVGTLDKRGARCTMMTYPHGETPMAVQIMDRPEWAEVDDWYRVIVEMVDIKTGNSIQVTHEEGAYEYKRDKTKFKRPHYTKIAESKAYRNAALALMPQNIVQDFKDQAIAKGQTIDLAVDLLQDRRDHVLTHAIAKGIPVDRQAINRLGSAQIDGLSSAAKTSLEDFQRSLEALNVLSRTPEPVEEVARLAGPKEAEETKAARTKAPPRKPATVRETEVIDQATGEITRSTTIAERDDPEVDPRQADLVDAVRKAPVHSSFSGME